MKKLVIVLFMLNILASATAVENEKNNIATLRDNTSISTQKSPEAIGNLENNDIKSIRNYPMQPPLIPHKIRNYQIDLKVNKCLSCHSRKNSVAAQAPMVSVTHYTNRDGEYLAEVAPRRYLCNQCHVPQLDNKPLIENVFEDMDSIIKAKSVKPEN